MESQLLSCHSSCIMLTTLKDVSYHLYSDDNIF